MSTEEQAFQNYHVPHIVKCVRDYKEVDLTKFDSGANKCPCISRYIGWDITNVDLSNDLENLYKEYDPSFEFDEENYFQYMRSFEVHENILGFDVSICKAEDDLCEIQFKRYKELDRILSTHSKIRKWFPYLNPDDINVF